MAKPMHCCMPTGHTQPDWHGVAWRGDRMRSRGACQAHCTSSLPTYHCPCSVVAMPAPKWCCLGTGTGMDGGSPYHACASCGINSTRVHNRHVCCRATRGVHGAMAVAPACHACVRAVMGPCWRSGQAYALLQAHRHMTHAHACSPGGMARHSRMHARAQRRGARKPFAPAACHPLPLRPCGYASTQCVLPWY